MEKYLCQGTKKKVNFGLKKGKIKNYLFQGTKKSKIYLGTTFFQACKKQNFDKNTFSGVSEVNNEMENCHI